MSIFLIQKKEKKEKRKRSFEKELFGKMSDSRDLFIVLFKKMDEDIVTKEFHSDHFHSICMMLQETSPDCFPKTFEKTGGKTAKRKLEFTFEQLGSSLWRKRKLVYHFSVADVHLGNSICIDFDSFQGAIEDELSYW